MKNTLQSWLNEYKEKTSKDYKDSRYPKPQDTKPDLLHLVANIKVALATNRHNEIAEEIKNDKKLNYAEIESSLKIASDIFEEEITLWRAYAKVR
jgi:hypothetical protein